MKYAEFKALGLSGGTWWSHFNPGMDCPGRKRLHCDLYRLPAQDRHSIHVLIRDRVQQPRKKKVKMTLEHHHRPYWMSAKQYGAMQRRLGIPF